MQWFGFFHILLPDPQISESMLISYEMDNNFVLLQNLLVDQVSHEYYKTYSKHIFVP
jgi:hypothetical protein